MLPQAETSTPSAPEFELDLAAWRARVSPQNPALWFNGRSYSYAELDRRALKLANRLHELGIVRGNRVAVLALNHVVHIDLLLAAVKIGFVFVPLNPKLPPGEIKRLAQLIQPELIFCDTRSQSVAETLEAPWTRLSDYAEWLAVGTDSPPQPPRPAIAADDTHLLLATSGVTGLARLACLPYRQTLGNAARAAKTWRLGPSDVAIQSMPCAHASIGLVALPMLHAGGMLVMMPFFTPEDYIQLGIARRSTVLAMSAASYHRLTSSTHFDSVQQSNAFRLVWCAGGPSPTPVRWAFSRLGLPILPIYGLAEAGFHIFDISPDDVEANPQAIGRPLPEFQASIITAEGTIADAGEVGELTLGGAQIFSGYFGDDEATRKRLVNGRLHTGDQFRCDAQGLFTFCGRLGEAYAVLGDDDEVHTVYPADVEHAMLQCFGVLACAAFAGASKGESVVAVTLQSGARRNADQLAVELGTRVPAYKLPSRILIVDALPCTEWGCIDRTAARRQFVGSGS